MRLLGLYTILISTAIAFSSLLSTATAQPLSLNYCKKDAARLCKGVQLGKGRMLECLKAHENDLTVGCAKELKELKAKMGK